MWLPITPGRRLILCRHRQREVLTAEYSEALKQNFILNNEKKILFLNLFCYNNFLMDNEQWLKSIESYSRS